MGANSEQTRQRIIGAAMRCVAEVGYSQASIREIARAADMTSGSLYHYFPNKAELLKATGEEIERIVLPRLRDAAARSDDVDLTSGRRAGRVKTVDARLSPSGRVPAGHPRAERKAVRALADRITPGPGPCATSSARSSTTRSNGAR